MAEVIKRLEKDKLSTEEYKFVSDLPLYEAYYGNMKQELEEEKRARQEEQKARQEEQKARQEEQKARQEDHQKLLEGIKNLLRRGETVESIADLLVRRIEEIAGFVAEIEAKKEGHVEKRDPSV